EMIPCAHCERYVKPEDSVCPFCEQPLVGSAVSRLPVPKGLSRAAAYAVRAAVVGGAIAAAVACGDDDDDDKSGKQASAGTSSGGETSDEQGSGGKGLGGMVNPDNTGGDGGFTPVPIYGGPFPDMVRAKV